MIWMQLTLRTKSAQKKTNMRPSLPPLDSLTLRQQIAQMVTVRAAGYLFDHQIRYPAWEPPNQTLRHWVQDWGVGGVILLGGSAAELALRTQQLQDWAGVPLLISADIEEGVGQRFAGATWFPPPMAIGAIARQNLSQAEELAHQMGACTAQEARAIGLNWVLAPVVDVNNNPDNPVINVRAFGETPEQVIRLTTAFIRGAQAYPVLTTAKHFPGHGDTAVDSHLELPVISHNRERLNQVELPPFVAAIAAGVDSVMSAHLLIPALDSQYPATLSPAILTGLLRQELGFDGLVSTDALIMGAIAKRYGIGEAAVLAVLAGADILMMPPDPETAILAVEAAVEAGRIAPEQILTAVERIWRAKHQVCSPDLTVSGPSHAWEEPPPAVLQADTLLSQLAQPSANTAVEQILQASMQSQGSPRNWVSDQPWRNLILVDSLLNCDFLNPQAPAIVLPQQAGAMTQILDSHTPESMAQLSDAAAQPTLLQLFIRGNPFRGSAGLTHQAANWLQLLLDSHQLQAIALYGSPYILEKFRPNLPPDLPLVFSLGQMPTAQRLALVRLGFEHP